MPKKINARKKGHAYELKIVSEMKELGFENAETSRNASRKMDAMKVDLVSTGPFYIQCKATERYPDFHTILDQMPAVFHWSVIMNKKNRKGEIVVMKKHDFYEMVRLMIASNVISVESGLQDHAE